MYVHSYRNLILLNLYVFFLGVDCICNGWFTCDHRLLYCFSVERRKCVIWSGLQRPTKQSNVFHWCFVWSCVRGICFTDVRLIHMLHLFRNSLVHGISSVVSGQYLHTILSCITKHACVVNQLFQELWKLSAQMR